MPQEPGICRKNLRRLSVSVSYYEVSTSAKWGDADTDELLCILLGFDEEAGVMQLMDDDPV